MYNDKSEIEENCDGPNHSWRVHENGELSSGKNSGDICIDCFQIPETAKIQCPGLRRTVETIHRRGLMDNDNDKEEDMSKVLGNIENNELKETGIELCGKEFSRVELDSFSEEVLGEVLQQTVMHLNDFFTYLAKTRNIEAGIDISNINISNIDTRSFGDTIVPLLLEVTLKKRIL